MHLPWGRRRAAEDATLGAPPAPAAATATATAAQPADDKQALAGPTSEHGYKKLETTAELKAVTPFAFSADDSNDMGRPWGSRVAYLESLRGLIAFEVSLWAFFRILAPGAYMCILLPPPPLQYADTCMHVGSALCAGCVCP